MVRFTIGDIHQLSANQPSSVRNVAVIAHVDHGKSTLTDSLLAGAGQIKYQDIGKRLTDTREDEKEQGITIKSTGISMAFELKPEACAAAAVVGPSSASADGEKASGGAPTGEPRSVLVNLIDSPGHVDFSGEVTAALRLTDGALVVVDCIEGVRVQTETVLRQALAEGVKPVLAINKLDRAFLEVQYSNEEIYESLEKVLESVNRVVATYQQVDEDTSSTSTGLLIRPLDPTRGDVCFTAGYQGWGFNIQQFARFYAKRSKLTESQLVEKLWGHNYFNPATRRWTTQRLQTNADGSTTSLPRGFSHFILEPIRKIFFNCVEGKLEDLKKVLEALAIQLPQEEVKTKTGKELIKGVMQRWIPACDAIVEMMVNHLPSPLEAQKYRAGLLYLGPQIDATAEAIRNCDPKGPLVIYIGKMAPSNDKRLIAFGRVFSGTATAGAKVRIVGPDYDPEQKEGAKPSVTAASLQGVHLLFGKRIESVDYITCGNPIAITGIDKHIVKSCTIISDPTSYPIKDMKHSVSPVMRQAVSTVNPADLPALVEALRRLSKVETLAECTVSETGEHIVAGAGELHLSILMRDLQAFAGVPLKISEPVVTFKETISKESSMVCMTKSANKHNRFFVKAEPLGEELTTYLESFESSASSSNKSTGRTATASSIASVLPLKDQSGPEVTAARHALVENYDWNLVDSKKIWIFRPTSLNSCVVVDQTQGVQNLDSVRDAFAAGFLSANVEGVLCGEAVRGVRYNLLDVKLHSESVHRGAGQVIPAARRVLHASQLCAGPRLLEPMFQVEIECPNECLGSIYGLMNRKRGQIIESVPHGGGIPLLSVKAHVPVMESFSLIEQLRLATSGQAFAHCHFSHWSLVPGSYETDILPTLNLNAKAAAAAAAAEPSLFAKIVRETRLRKGMSPDIPTFDYLCDKL